MGSWLVEPFRIEGRWRFGAIAIIALYAALNGIVLYNVIRHPPEVGYDIGAHLAYGEALSKGAFPTPKQSTEFFSPPLAYVPMAVLQRLGMASLLAAKVTQIIHLFYSLVLTYFVLRICLEISQDYRLRAYSLLCLGMIPAYYRTFSMIRGEPVLAMLATVSIWLAIRVFVQGRPRILSVIVLGILLGLAALARQWAAFLFPVVGALAIYRAWCEPYQQRLRIIAQLAIVAMLCAVTGGWFYLHLYRDHGSISAFNRSSKQGFSFSNEPASFYFSFPVNEMLTEPYKYNLGNRLMPVYYADLWGDYWAYFLIRGKTATGRRIPGLRRSGGDARVLVYMTNLKTMSPYLGRIMVVSIIQSLVLLGGLATGVRGALKPKRSNGEQPQANTIAAFLGGCVLMTAAGYFWFVVSFPSNTGDTIRAAYVLQIYPALAILAGLFLLRLQRRWPGVFLIVMSFLLAATTHNAGAFFTRYT